MPGKPDWIYPNYPGAETPCIINSNNPGKEKPFKIK
jgi:hypothetical protein